MNIVIILIAAICCIAPNAIAQTAADREQITQVVEAFQNDFNDGGFRNVARYATTDWIHIGPDGQPAEGERLLNGLRAIHQAFLKGVTMTIESSTIKFVAPDVAVALVVHKVSAYTTPDGQKHENERQMKGYVVVKKGARWLLVLDQNTIIPR